MRPALATRGLRDAANEDVGLGGAERVDVELGSLPVAEFELRRGAYYAVEGLRVPQRVSRQLLEQPPRVGGLHLEVELGQQVEEDHFVEEFAGENQVEIREALWSSGEVREDLLDLAKEGVRCVGGSVALGAARPPLRVVGPAERESPGEWGEEEAADEEMVLIKEPASAGRTAARLSAPWRSR